MSNRVPNQRILFFQVYPKQGQLPQLLKIKDKWLTPPGFGLSTNATGVTHQITLDGNEYSVRGRNYLGEFVPSRLRVYFTDGVWMLRLEASIPATGISTQNVA